MLFHDEVCCLIVRMDIHPPSLYMKIKSIVTAIPSCSPPSAYGSTLSPIPPLPLTLQ